MEIEFYIFSLIASESLGDCRKVLLMGVFLETFLVKDFFKVKELLHFVTKWQKPEVYFILCLQDTPFPHCFKASCY